MAPRKKRSRSANRHRVGRVSYYLHHGSWWVYYREEGRPVRERIADCETDAERVAAQSLDETKWDERALPKPAACPDGYQRPEECLPTKIAAAEIHDRIA